MRNKVIALLLLYAVVITTACPTKTINDAKSASRKVATYADLGVNLTRDLYRSNFLSLEQKDKLADGFILLARAGVAFDSAIANAETAYGSDMPKDEIGRLSAVFDAQVVAKFLEILATLKLVPSAGNYRTIVEGLRTAILLAARVFGTARNVELRIAAARS